jgi:hypothetical protein
VALKRFPVARSLARPASPDISLLLPRKLGEVSQKNAARLGRGSLKIKKKWKY